MKRNVLNFSSLNVMNYVLYLYLICCSIIHIVTNTHTHTPLCMQSPYRTYLVTCVKLTRHLRSDRKNEVVTDLKEEMEQLKGAMQHLQHEKKELAEDAKAARVYRDEIETLKVQSAKVEKLEADVVKYRQKAEDTEYLKKRIAVSLSAPLCVCVCVCVCVCEGVCVCAVNVLVKVTSCCIHFYAYNTYTHVLMDSLCLCTHCSGSQTTKRAHVGNKVPSRTESRQPTVSI